MLHSISFLLALLLFWLLLSGMYTLFLVSMGIASAIGILALAHRMDVVDHEGFPIHLAWPAFLSYWPWLIGQIIASAWDVSKRILDPALPISPALVEFKPSQQSELGLVIHANSITLTPGTISVEVDADRFLVHALTQQGADGLAGSEMDRRCSAMEDTPYFSRGKP